MVALARIQVNTPSRWVSNWPDRRAPGPEDLHLPHGGRGPLRAGAGGGRPATQLRAAAAVRVAEGRERREDVKSASAAVSMHLKVLFE